MHIHKIAAVVVMAVIGTWSADAASTNDGESPAGPQFTNFKDGDTVSNPVIVRFTSSGATMRLVGHMGHLHLIIDAPLPAAGQMVPMDSRHIHLLHGETQATLRLLPGDHSLQLVLAGGGSSRRQSPDHVSKNHSPCRLGDRNRKVMNYRTGQFSAGGSWSHSPL